MLTDKCRSCIHEPVCWYKTKLEDIEKLYIPIKNQAVQYDVFDCEIRCKQYRKNEPYARSTKEVCDGGDKSM